MTSNAKLFPSDGISYEDRLPVSWAASSSLCSESEQHRIDSDNQTLLEALLILDEPGQDVEDEQEAVAHDQLRRLDVKLNLLMSLVRELLAATTTLPDERSVLLGAQGMCIYDVDTAGVEAGYLLDIRLYLDPKFPRPFILQGHVSAVQDHAISLIHCPLGDTIQNLLDKYIFRHHRRAVALKRQRAGL